MKRSTRKILTQLFAWLLCLSMLIPAQTAGLASFGAEKNGRAEKTAEAAQAERILEAELLPGADGKSRDESAAVTIKGKLPEGAAAEARPVDVDIPGRKVRTAYDITIKANGREWQPEEPLNVTISDRKIKQAGKDHTALQIYHLEDETKDKAEFVADAAAKKGKVSFEAESFSVYVVIDHEEETVKNPRVMFHFISPGAEDRQTYYEGTAYSFKNKGVKADATNYTQKTQILKNGESLELIEDPGKYQGNDFYGWYVVDPEEVSGKTNADGIGTSDPDKICYKWPTTPDQISFKNAIKITEKNVSIGDTVNWSMKGISGSGAVDSDGNVHVLLAPLYDNYSKVNFMLHPKEQDSTIMHSKLVVHGSSSESDVKISDIRASSPDPIHLIFKGWEYNAGTEADPDWQEHQTVEYNGAEMHDPGKDGVYLTVGADQEKVDLYPVFIEARWVDFFVGDTESGAAYVASQFRESWGTPENPPVGMTENPERTTFDEFDVSERPGYIFRGWYAFAKIDPETGAITNKDTAEEVEVSYLAENREVKTVTVSTKAVRLTNDDGSVNCSETLYLTDHGDGTGSLGTSGDIPLFGAGSSESCLKLYDGLDRLQLSADWEPSDTMITIVYWTEDEQEEGYVAPEHEEDDYTVGSVQVVTTQELNSQLPKTYLSGSKITLDELKDFKVDGVGVLDRNFLNNTKAVPDGEEKFYDLNEDLSAQEVTIKGDGSVFFDVYFERKTFKLVFHLGRDGYVKSNGQQRESYMSDPRYADWDGNWIQFMYKDWKVNNSPTHATQPGLGYIAGPTARSYAGEGNLFTMEYNGRTYTSGYETTPENVKGDYVPGDDEDVYVITAKYGAYIGDRWPTPTNDAFTFTDPEGSKLTMYIWAAYYGSEYCYLAQHRATYGNPNGNNPDVNGVYEYMSDTLCSNRAGDAIINENQVHHLVAYFGDKGKEGIIKRYHLMRKAVPGTYDPEQVTLVQGADYLQYAQTTWCEEHGLPGELQGYEYYEVRSENVISNVEPMYQMGWALDGYERVYSCYDAPDNDNQDIYFFYAPKQYELEFFVNGEVIEDEYYYNETLAGADKYTDQLEVPEGYYFAGWYTNATGAGGVFDFANERMPDHNQALDPIMKPLQYTVKLDPSGGVIDHRTNTSQATYFTADYGEPIGEYHIERNYIKLTEEELDPASPVYYTGTKYYYINTQRLGIPSEGDWGLPPDLRNAVYVAEDDLDAYYDWYCGIIDSADPDYWSGISKLTKEEFLDNYADYPYRRTSGEHYIFMGWFQVYEDGTVDTMPYNFNDPAKGPIELRAKWRLDGGYYIEYDPYTFEDDGAGNITAFAGEQDPWTDPGDPSKRLYADQAPTHILRAPENTTPGWVFRGWRVVKANGTAAYEGEEYTKWEPFELDGSGDPVYYQPGEQFTVDASLVTDTSLYGGIIHMQAYYERDTSSSRRPDVTNLILDANDDYGGYLNTKKSSDLPPLSGPGSQTVNTEDHLDPDGNPTQILMGDFQSNIALHLYRYATEKTIGGVAGTNFFDNDGDYRLIGFDENSDPEAPTTGEPYVPTYAPDSVAAVTRAETDKTLYAMWEPMVYVTFVNTTSKPITINLAGTGETTVSVVNLCIGEYGRERIGTTITVPAKSGSVDGEIRIALPKAVAGTDSISATAENDHLGRLMSVSGEYPSGTPYGTGSEDVVFGNAVLYTGQLVSDKDGIVVTYTEELDAEVLYDVNGGTWNPASGEPLYHHSAGDLYYAKAVDIINNGGEYEPEDPTRDGKVFLGWTDNPDVAAHTDFSQTAEVTWGDTTITPDAGGTILEKIRSDYLWDFSKDPALLYDNDKTLYAVWSDTVTVTYNVAFTESPTADPQVLHQWTGPATTSQPGAYVFYRSDDGDKLITYTMAKGDRAVPPENPDPTVEKPSWNFMKWLIYNTTTDKYRYSTHAANDNNYERYGFSFTECVYSDVTLVTSWAAEPTQTFTFKIRNETVGGTTDKDFDYTIAITDELVYGKMGDSYSNVNGVPDVRWGSVNAKLKPDQEYTVRIDVLYISNWGGANGVDVTVIDRDGVVVKSGHVITCNHNTYRNFVSDHKYTLTVTQTTSSSKTTVTGEDEFGTLTYDTDDESRSFTFNSSVSRTASQAEHYTPVVNPYAGGDNGVTVVFRNSIIVAPTDVDLRLIPYLLILAAGAAITLLRLRKKRRS